MSGLSPPFLPFLAEDAKGRQTKPHVDGRNLKVAMKPPSSSPPVSRWCLCLLLLPKGIEEGLSSRLPEQVMEKRQVSGYWSPLHQKKLLSVIHCPPPLLATIPYMTPLTMRVFFENQKGIRKSGYPLHLSPSISSTCVFFSVRPSNGQYWGVVECSARPALVHLYALACRPPAPSPLLPP